MNNRALETGTEFLGHHARILNLDEISKLLKDEVTLNEFKRNQLELNAKKNWDLFYKRNENRFFKDRHWTTREFEELADDAVVDVEKPVLLEVGCGVGNLIFPLINAGTKYFVHACDFSPVAINLLKEHPSYNTEQCNAFVCDIVNDNLCESLQPDSVHIVSMIFVLSAIHPHKMLAALRNIYQVLQPGGLLLFRDYGLYDQAMLRFKPGHKLGDYFYVRQDGTRAFYFSEEYLENLMKEACFKIITNEYVTRETVNFKKNVSVPRIFIQGKFKKPHNVTGT